MAENHEKQFPNRAKYRPFLAGSSNRGAVYFLGTDARMSRCNLCNTLAFLGKGEKNDVLPILRPRE